MPVVFAYGCLMDVSVMGRVCAAAEPWAGWADPSRSAGRLAGHRLAFPIGHDDEWVAAVAGVVPDEPACVEGGLWAVTAAGLKELDAYEEVGRGLYERDRRTVTLLRPAAGASSVEAWVYRPTASSPAGKEHRPSVAYREALVRGAEFFGLRPAYRDRLARLAVEEDRAE